MKHDDYPALQFTCQGGPLDGEAFAFPKAKYVRGGQTPDIAEAMRDGLRISTFRRVAGERIPLDGRYRIAFNAAEGTYSATHEPSDTDIYFKVPERSGPMITAGQIPPAAETFGKPRVGVIPQPASTLDLFHGQS